MAQMVQTGVVPPDKANFIDTSYIFDKILPVMGEKNVAEFKLAAQAPPPPEGTAPGIASQPGEGGLNAEAEVSNVNPEDLESLLG